MALIDADFSLLASDKKQHAADILKAIRAKGGLEYSPRERTIQGRVFQHAADSRLLVEHLVSHTTPQQDSELEE